MGYVMERPWTDPLSLSWKAGEVTQKEIIMRENKGVVGVENPLKGTALSLLPARHADWNHWVTAGHIMSVCVCVL